MIVFPLATAPPATRKKKTKKKRKGFQKLSAKANLFFYGFFIWLNRQPASQSVSHLVHVVQCMFGLSKFRVSSIHKNKETKPLDFFFFFFVVATFGWVFMLQSNSSIELWLFYCVCNNVSVNTWQSVHIHLHTYTHIHASPMLKVIFTVNVTKTIWFQTECNKHL